MSDNKKNFHEFAVESALFKGRGDWYFCFLKSEKIAHVLIALSNSVSEGRRGELVELSRSAGMLPRQIAYFALGKVSAESVLADLLVLLSSIRLLQTNGVIVKENAHILAQECEALVEKFAASVHLSPFALSEDFAVPQVERAELVRLPSLARDKEDVPVKDNKGQAEVRGPNRVVSKGQQERVERIRDFVLQNKGVSIKDIARVVQGCSEKTIQRELAVLVQQKVIQKVGERRWSLYMPAL